jgi:glycosyltransferase involved in cell wall biosynthesis
MRHYAEWLAARDVNCAHIPIGAYHEPELLDESASQELLFFTTLAPFKGLEILLEAFHKLHTEFPHLRLTIAGAEHTRFPNYPQELKKRFNGSDGVEWLGQIPEDQVKQLFQRAKIVVLPYTASTGSSSVLYQAATWGRAIVASDLYEIRELVLENNMRVEFFKNGEVEDLIASLRGLLNSPERRKSQTQHNFTAIQRARPEETCKRYIKAFNLALEKRRSPKRIEIQVAGNEFV